MMPETIYVIVTLWIIKLWQQQKNPQGQDVVPA